MIVGNVIIVLKSGCQAIDASLILLGCLFLLVERRGVSKTLIFAMRDRNLEFIFPFIISGFPRYLSLFLTSLTPRILPRALFLMSYVFFTKE